MKEINYTKIDKDHVTFELSGNIFTINLDGADVVSADNDGSVTFDQRYIMEVDEENQILYIED